MTDGDVDVVLPVAGLGDGEQHGDRPKSLMIKPLAALATINALVALSACSSTTPQTQTPAASTAPSQSASTGPTSTPSSTTAPSGKNTAVTIAAGDRTFDATINDSQVSRDFLTTLPTTLPWERNSGIEHITELPAPMTETGPFYTEVEASDIVYHNPMDSITIIYAPTSSVPTLTKMGEITSDLEAFKDLPDSVEMRIELK